MTVVDTGEPFPVWASKLTFVTMMIGGASCGIAILLALALKWSLDGEVVAGALGTVTTSIVGRWYVQRRLRVLFASHPQRPVAIDLEDRASGTRGD